jgi:hypothetical protein
VALKQGAADVINKTMMVCKRMQEKIGQCFNLHGDDFHLDLMQLLDFEVRCIHKLLDVSEIRVDPEDLEESEEVHLSHFLSSPWALSAHVHVTMHYEISTNTKKLLF